jgi:uncharacterized membrane protein
MNLHLSAHFPMIQIVVALVGAVVYAIAKSDPWKEYGKVLLWSGCFAALFAAAGSC